MYEHAYEDQLTDRNAMDTLTTSQVAKAFHVSGKTARNMFDTGLIDGHFVPGGSAHRRYHKDSVLEVMQRHGIDMKPYSLGVVYMTDNDYSYRGLLHELEGANRIMLYKGRNAVDTGMTVGENRIDVVIADYSTVLLSEIHLAATMRPKKAVIIDSDTVSFKQIAIQLRQLRDATNFFATTR